MSRITFIRQSSYHYFSPRLNKWWAHTVCPLDLQFVPLFGCFAHENNRASTQQLWSRCLYSQTLTFFLFKERGRLGYWIAPWKKRDHRTLKCLKNTPWIFYNASRANFYLRNLCVISEGVLGRFFAKSSHRFSTFG